MNIRRRTFIRATGVSLALPWLNAFADDTTGLPVLPVMVNRHVG